MSVGLNGQGHDSEAYPVTGPETFTYADAAAAIPEELGRDIEQVRAGDVVWFPRTKRTATALASELPIQLGTVRPGGAAASSVPAPPSQRQLYSTNLLLESTEFNSFD